MTNPPTIEYVAPVAVEAAIPITPVEKWLLIPLFRIWIFIKRSFVVMKSYRTAFFLSLVSIFISFTTFYFIAKFLALNANNPYLTMYGGDYIRFAVVGSVFSGFMGLAFGFMTAAIGEGIGMGTLEYMLLSRSGLFTITLSSRIWDIVSLVISTMLSLVAIHFVYNVDFTINLPLMILITLFMTIPMMGIGMISAGILMVIKRGDPVSYVFGVITGLASGSAFPVTVLPTWLQNIGNALPNTHALEAMRQVMINNVGIDAIWDDLRFLILSGLILFTIGILFFRGGFYLARKRGTLAQL